MKSLVMAFFILTSVVSGSINQGNATTVANSQSTIIALEKQPFEFYQSPNIENKSEEIINLSQRKAVKNRIINVEEWFIKNDLKFSAFVFPRYQPPLDEVVPDFVSWQMQDDFLSQATYDENYIYVIYENRFMESRYMAIYDINTGEEKYSFDFISLRYPKYITNPEYTQQRVNWAHIEGNVLYISTAHHTHAKLSGYKNGFITAINLEDKSILWQSQSLVSNSCNFIVSGDTIITGYGFTDEDDHLYLLNKWTGEVYEKIQLKSMPQFFIMKDNILYVRTYNTDYEFDIKQ